MVVGEALAQVMVRMGPHDRDRSLRELRVVGPDRDDVADEGAAYVEVVVAEQLAHSPNRERREQVGDRVVERPLVRLRAPVVWPIGVLARHCPVECAPDARLLRVPAPGARVDSYPVEERDGWIWVFLGDLPEPERPPIPRFPEFGRTGWRAVRVAVMWNAHYTRVVENTADVAHTPFVHRTSFGDPHATVIPEFTVTGDEHTTRASILLPRPAAPRKPKRGGYTEVTLAIHMPATNLVDGIMANGWRTLLLITHLPVDAHTIRSSDILDRRGDPLVVGEDFVDCITVLEGTDDILKPAILAAPRERNVDRLDQRLGRHPGGECQASTLDEHLEQHPSGPVRRQRRRGRRGVRRRGEQAQPVVILLIRVGDDAPSVHVVGDPGHPRTEVRRERFVFAVLMVAQQDGTAVEVDEHMVAAGVDGDRQQRRGPPTPQALHETQLTSRVDDRQPPHVPDPVLRLGGPDRGKDRPGLAAGAVVGEVGLAQPDRQLASASLRARLERLGTRGWVQAGEYLRGVAMQPGIEAWPRVRGVRHGGPGIAHATRRVKPPLCELVPSVPRQQSPVTPVSQRRLGHDGPTLLLWRDEPWVIES